MAEEQLVLDLIIEDKESQKSVHSMRKQIKELQGDMMRLDPNSEGFKEAAMQAAALKDEIAASTEQMDAFSDAGSLKGVHNSFGNLGQQMKSMDFGGMTRSVMGMSNALNNIKFSTIISGIQGLGGAFKKLSIAIMTNPIFLIAAAIIAITAAIVLLVKEMTKETEEMRTQRIAREALINVQEQAYKQTSKTIVQTQVLLKVIQDENNAMDLRKEKLKELNDIMGTNLSLTDNLTAATNLYIAQMMETKELEIVIDRMAELNAQMNNTYELAKESKPSFWSFRTHLDSVTTGFEMLTEGVTIFDEKAAEMYGRNYHQRWTENITASQRDLQTEYEALFGRATDLIEGTTDAVEEHIKSINALKNQFDEVVQATTDLLNKTEKKKDEIAENSKKRTNDQYAKELEAANKYYNDLVLKAMEEGERMEFLYNQDLLKFEENLRRKLWSQEQYDNSVKARQAEYQTYLDAVDAERLVKEQEFLKAKEEAQLFFLAKMRGDLSPAEILKEEYAKDLLSFQDLLQKKLISLDEYNQAVRQLDTDLRAGLAQIEIDNMMSDADLKLQMQNETINSVMTLEGESYATRLEMLKEYYENGLISEEQYNQSSKELQQQRLNNYMAVAGMLGDITNELFSAAENRAQGNAKKEKKIAKQKFNVEKGVSSVKTIINTMQGVSAALTNPPPLSFVMAALTGLMGAASLATILSKKFPENGESGGGIPSSATSTPTITSPSDSALFSSGGGTPSEFTPFGNQDMTAKVIVVESDITSTQQNVAKVGVQSSL